MKITKTNPPFMIRALVMTTLIHTHQANPALVSKLLQPPPIKKTNKQTTDYPNQAELSKQYNTSATCNAAIVIIVTHPRPSLSTSLSHPCPLPRPNSTYLLLQLRFLTRLLQLTLLLTRSSSSFRVCPHIQSPTPNSRSRRSSGAGLR